MLCFVYFILKSRTCNFISWQV